MPFGGFTLWPLTGSLKWNRPPNEVNGFCRVRVYGTGSRIRAVKWPGIESESFMKYCLHPGCDVLVPKGSSRCDDHQLTRPSFADRYGISDARWQRLRRKVLRRDWHSCVRCGASDRLEVDHIIPRSQGGTNALTNLQTLCRVCHTAKTTADRRDDGQGT